MRLRQLARKLDVDTEKVIHYLKACNLPCEDDSNAKLSDEQVEVLIQKFGPIYEPVSVEEEIVVEPVVIVPEVIEEEAIVSSSEEISEIKVEIESEIIEPPQPVVNDVKSAQELNTESGVIRAPKVELTGLRVVGKIELRTPKKKEESESEAIEEDNADQPKVITERTFDRSQKQRNQPRKNNVLTIAEQRQREEKIKLRRKKDAEQQAKEKKRENYLKKVKAKDKAETKKVLVENVVKKSPPKSSEQVGLITKFFNWMRRE